MARIHFEWDQNTLLMRDHAKHVCEQVLRAADGEYEGAAATPLSLGYSLHETGTCRMGHDPRTSVTNSFGQTHDVPNLYICDGSVFLNCTDKTTTLSILAFTLRSSEHLVEQFRLLSV